VRNAPAGEKPLVRSWRSRTGHQITIHDNAANKIEIITRSGHQLVMDDADKKITIQSAGGLKVVMSDTDKKVTVTSNGAVEIAAATDLALKGANVKIEASANLDLQAGGPATVKGATVSLN
jgi:formylmethanofuran dehydrogenase subunit C